MCRTKCRKFCNEVCTSGLQLISFEKSSKFDTDMTRVERQGKEQMILERPFTVSRQSNRYSSWIFLHLEIHVDKRDEESQ